MEALPYANATFDLQFLKLTDEKYDRTIELITELKGRTVIFCNDQPTLDQLAVRLFCNNIENVRMDDLCINLETGAVKCQSYFCVLSPKVFFTLKSFEHLQSVLVGSKWERMRC